ncbi:hypothetical protein PLEOSDRAFT_1103189 [Pleurotus ostreatus PC15]|uniref:DUF803-domain-containing protein n=1 Tax=Pleurotus ostreatus (strain PC15) TaxID=1137138 RepID=A0A067NZV7_PLEO1|nr:hypothetical protein PLEOSDRAFT_1103189 [Pleurotus ostreatus PC15]
MTALSHIYARHNATQLLAQGLRRTMQFAKYLYDMDDLPKVSTATFIGITVAIAGNVLISLALNLQKLAHRRLEDDKAGRSEELSVRRHTDNNSESAVDGSKPGDRQPLTNNVPRSYGARESTASIDPLPEHKRTSWGWLIPLKPRGKRDIAEEEAATLTRPLRVDVMTEETDRDAENGHGSHGPRMPSEGNESDYLKWLGFCLMNVGEIGNFISYAFAPASVVAPLGTFALIANCIFAPVMLGERFRKRDLLGMFIAIIGAVTVVLSSNSSNVRLDPDALMHAIFQTPFVVYTIIYIIAGISLASLSHGPLGKQWVFIDVGLCAVFGGFTVLSTKAISTLLTLEWLDIFKQWITYPVIVVLIGTGIGQVRYLNRALMQFDSKTVIPIQFVFFTLSAIIGSAILYGDFKTARFHQIVTFIYGCAATFLGVFIIAWAPENNSPEDEEEEPDVADTTPLASPRGDTSRLQGSVSRRRRAALVQPEEFALPPVLKTKRSSIAIGLSSAQQLLLVHSPTHGSPDRPRVWDAESDPLRTPTGSITRRRAISWFGEDGRGGGAQLYPLDTSADMHPS